MSNYWRFKCEFNPGVLIAFRGSSVLWEVVNFFEQGSLRLCCYISRTGMKHLGFVSLMLSGKDEEKGQKMQISIKQKRVSELQLAAKD